MRRPEIRRTIGRALSPGVVAAFLIVLQSTTMTLAAGAAEPAADIAVRSDPYAQVAIDQGRLGAEVPADVSFVDEFGDPVTIGSFLGEKPVLLVPVYYTCPNLCGVTLAGLFSGLEDMPLEPGSHYRVVAVSIDPREGPAEAAQAKADALKLFPHRNGDAAFHFLTGHPQGIERVMDAIGFQYGWDEEIQQYAHAAAVAVLSPQGRVARWLYGVQYEPLDLRLALTEAGRGAVGGISEQLLLLCYHYDPMTGRYGSLIQGSLRIGGLLTVAALGGFIGMSLYRERARARARADAKGPP